MFMTACPTILWDGQKQHKNRIVRVHKQIMATVSYPPQKEYRKKISSRLLQGADIECTDDVKILGVTIGYRMNFDSIFQIWVNRQNFKSMYCAVLGTI